MQDKKILIIDDEKSICDLIRDILVDEGYQVELAYTCKQGDQLRTRYQPDLILLDVWLPDGDGLSLLKKWTLNQYPYQAVIMMSGHGTIETAVNATQLGAYNFLEKPLAMADLTLAVKRALEYIQLKKENQQLKSKPSLFVEPVGSSSIISDIKKQCIQLSAHDAPIIIEGDTGSGRHTFAYFLHQQSSRNHLIEVNAALLSAKNVEAELFGFSQQHSNSQGKLGQAQDGILLLDNLDSMALDVQDIFIDLLKNKAFQCSQSQQNIPIKFQIISITRPTIYNLIGDGHFRSDLFYQLNVLPIKIPPLVDHMSDIEEIANHYVHFFHQHEGIPKIKLGKQAIECLLHYAWPGNVLELKNFIQRLMILQKGNVDPHIISYMLASSVAQGDNDVRYAFNWHQDFKSARKEFERSYFQFHLQANDFNVSKVSRITGVERSNLHRKIKDLNLET